MTRNEQLFVPRKQNTPSHWAFIVSAAITGIVCFASGNADAASGRSNAGLVTNNQTYMGFGNNLHTDTSLSSAERSTLHNRPLSVDSGARTDVNPTDVNPNHYSYTQAHSAPAHTTVTQQGRVVTTVREEATPYHAVAPLGGSDVNARSDAGVIVTHPITSTTPIMSNATGGVSVNTHINP